MYIHMLSSPSTIYIICMLTNIMTILLHQSNQSQDDRAGSIDPQLERQVETIHNLVGSYFGIVSKNIRDIVPKAIMHMMVNYLKDYLTTDLLPMIYSAGNQDSLMEESQQAAQRREEMIRMYHTCKDALQMISEVSTRTGKC